jgi:hypothetical protein
LQEGFNATLVQNSGYPVPNNGNVSLDIFSASVTLSEWTQMASGAASTKQLSMQKFTTNLFKSIYFYQFYRSYAPITGKSYCKAPIAPGIFEDTELGNPDNEYFKCH